MSIVPKYDAVAESYSAADYADAAAYYARRARMVVERGPRLQRGSTVLDIACGDGGLGQPLLELGDRLPRRRREPGDGRRRAAHARRARAPSATFEYVPPEPVEATTIFRSLYLVPDRREFFERVRASHARSSSSTSTRARSSLRTRSSPTCERRAGERVDLRPFLMPQRARLPRAVQALLFRARAAARLARR